MRRLRKEPSIIKEYDQTFRDQLHDGIIERVEETEEQLLSQTHYLPHQAVIRSDALTTKLRVVFDASAEVKPNCPSLNDWLLRSTADREYCRHLDAFPSSQSGISRQYRESLS